MDFLKKMKQKLAEGFEDDEDDVRGVNGIGCPDADGESDGEAGLTDEELIFALKKEVSELRTHINKNHGLYLKRLAKRKSRIHDLEDMVRNNLDENKSLQVKLQQNEDCKKQLSECRDNLEQMENHQSQELSKIKALLLGAENALELEKSERLKLRDEISQLNYQNDELAQKLKAEEGKGSGSAPEALSVAARPWPGRSRSYSVSDIPPLEPHFWQNASGDPCFICQRSQHNQQADDVEAISETASADRKEVQELETFISTLKSDNARINDALHKAMAERDSAKASLLEVEISKHEQEGQGAELLTQARLQMAQLATEKETLEVTLDLREKEFKARKEEQRNQQEKAEAQYRQVASLAETRLQEVSDLEARCQNLQKAVMEGEYAKSHLEAKVGELRSEIVLLEARVASLEGQVASKGAELQGTHDRFEQVERDLLSSLTLNETLDNEVSQLKAHAAQLQLEHSSTLEEKDSLVASLDKAKVEVERLDKAVREHEDTFPARLESSALVQSLRQKIVELEDAIIEKKQSAKVLQQKLVDMKKTFQKELRFQENNSQKMDTSQAEDESRLLEFLPMSRSSPERVTTRRPASNPISNDAALFNVDTDLTYLKHVIFKFLTSREYEAKQLTRAVATLLRFTPEEEKFLKDHLEWKSSWFGSKPNLEQF